MPKLTANVLLAHPDTNEPVVLVEGTELPDWAYGFVGDHVLDEPKPVAEPTSEPEGESPEATEPEGEKPAGRRTAK